MREIALYSSWLAQAYVDANEIDEAAAVASRVYDLAAASDSPRAVLLRSHAHDFGSPGAWSFSTFSFARPDGLHLDADLRVAPASSRRSAICFHVASRTSISSLRCRSPFSSRLRPARTSSRTASQPLP
ncbi:hypothetical protein [Embleya sp. NPDC005575]|uniref:hypothetical protein n=1 Tax=Embleya sp. NPDC005575 TaxID=3156892 RepID=UPI0033B70E9E